MSKTKTKTKTRRKKSLSGGKTIRRRRSRRGLSSKGILSDFTNPTMLATAAKKTFGAVAGGGAAVIVNKILPPTTGKFARLALALGIGFVGVMLNMPSAGAGFTGAMVANTFPNGFLNEDAQFADDDALAELPLFLDEDGAPMVLDEETDGMRYLSEDEIQMLQERGAFSDYEIVG